jgi:hypothetical protein
MVGMSVKDELLEYLVQLDESQQHRLLGLARTMAKTRHIRGESGESLMQSLGLFRDDALDEMSRAINDNCERIDWSGDEHFKEIDNLRIEKW